MSLWVPGNSNLLAGNMAFVGNCTAPRG
ncbi:hypothetical protein AB0M91_16155 [Micromonospora rifamycinica]